MFNKCLCLIENKIGQIEDLIKGLNGKQAFEIMRELEILKSIVVNLKQGGPRDEGQD